MKTHEYLRSAACLVLATSVLCAGCATMVTAECKATHPMEQLPATLVTLLGIAVGEDTVESVKQKLGDAKRIRAAESDGTRVCYRVKAAGGTAYVVFEFGPLGGFNTVTAYRVSRSAEGMAESECFSLKKDHSVEPVKGLHLGIARPDFVKLMGPGACEEKNSVEYAYAGKRRMNGEEEARFGKRNPGVATDPYFDASAGIMARFDSTGLKEFYVYKTESY
jgi:hypothetical protein